MKYNFREGVKLDKKKPTWLLWILAIIVLAGGAYGAAQFIAPQLVSMPLSAKSTADATMQKMQTTKPADVLHLYVPQLNVDMPIVSAASDAVVAWQKEANTPDKDGAMVLRAVYQDLGLTPWETRDRSPFYNLDKLQKDDEVYVDNQGKRYAYRITLTNQPTYKLDADKKLLVLIPVDKTGNTAKNSIVTAEYKGVIATAEPQQ